MSSLKTIGIAAGVVALLACGNNNRRAHRAPALPVYHAQPRVANTSSSTVSPTVPQNLTKVVAGARTSHVVRPVGDVVCSDYGGSEIRLNREWTENDFNYTSTDLRTDITYSCRAANPHAKISEDGLKLEQVVTVGEKQVPRQFDGYTYDAQGGVVSFRLDELGVYNLHAKVVYEGDNGTFERTLVFNVGEQEQTVEPVASTELAVVQRQPTKRVVYFANIPLGGGL